MAFEEVGLSLRCINALRRVGYYTMREVADLHVSQLEAVPNLGAKSVGEIRGKLRDLGLSLADRPTGASDPSRRQQPGGWSLQALTISPVVLSALHSAGFRHVDELMRLDHAQLETIAGLGASELSELRRGLLELALQRAARAVRTAIAEPDPKRPTGGERPPGSDGAAEAEPPPRVRSTRARTMIDMRVEGGTLQEIGDRFGVTRERVRQILRAEGVDSADIMAARTERVAATIASHHDQVMELYREGLDITEIAGRIGVTAGELRVAVRADATPADRAARRARRRRCPDVTYSDEDLLRGIRRAAQELGDVPTSAGYLKLARRLGLPSLPTVTNRLGGWSEAVRAAGMTPNPTHDGYTRRWSSDACWRALRRLISELGDAPTAQQYQMLSEGDDDLPSLATVRHRLGRWSGVVDRLMSGDEHPILGRLGISPGTPPAERDESILLAYLEERVGDEDLAHLTRDGLFKWRDEYGDPPDVLRTDDA